ncbi:MAG: FAD-dependent oxidoreductase [Pseudomonadota bacterium]
MTTGSHIVVVGAGPTGLSCARRLVEHGCSVRVIEKSRGIGGRVATRRRDGMQVDHGAPFLEGGSPAADRLIEAASAAGDAAPWPAGGAACWTGVPGMSSLFRSLAQGVEITFSQEVKAIRPEQPGWRLETGEGDQTADHVVLALPAPQVIRLLERSEPGLVEQLRTVGFRPTYTLIVSFEADPGWTTLLRPSRGPFELLVGDATKPGRPDGHVWAAHADQAWSEANLERERPDAADALLTALEEAMGRLPPVVLSLGHRWRYAQTSHPLGAPFVESADGTLLAGGDWALGQTIGDALTSGEAMADALIARLSSAGTGLET